MLQRMCQLLEDLRVTSGNFEDRAKTLTDLQAMHTGAVFPGRVPKPTPNHRHRHLISRHLYGRLAYALNDLRGGAPPNVRVHEKTIGDEPGDGK